MLVAGAGAAPEGYEIARAPSTTITIATVPAMRLNQDCSRMLHPYKRSTGAGARMK